MEKTTAARKNRAHGTGQITEIIAGKKYRIRVTQGTRLNGKPRSVSETINGTRAQAEARAAVLYEQLKTDTARGAGVTLAAYFEQVFLPKQKTKQRTQANVNGYLTAWKHTPDAWKRQAIREPTYSEIENHLYKSDEFKKKDKNGKVITPHEYNSGAAAQWLKYFKAILRDAWKAGLLSRQPLTAPPKPPKGNNNAGHVWDEAETAAAWLLLRGNRLEAYALIAGAAGTRREETIALNWEDVTFTSERRGILEEITAHIKINKAITEEDGEKDTKTEHSARIIPVKGYAARRLYEIRQARGAICQTLKGERLKISGLRRQWGNLWNAPADLRYSRSRETRHRSAGIFYGKITKITPNALRHSNISLFSEMGVNDSTNQRYHGHAPRTVETRHYIRRYNRALQEAAETIAQAYEEAAEFAIFSILEI